MFGRRSLGKNLICGGALVIGLSALIYFPVYAETNNALSVLGQTGQAAGLPTTDIYTIIGRILRVIYGLLGAIALGITLWGGYTWMTAAGEAKQVEEAKGILRNGIIGLVIVMSAFGITEFIMSRLGGAVSGTGGGGEEGGSTYVDTDLASYVGNSVIGKVIESHDPARDAKNVPRNKFITVVFKIPFDPTSLINGKNGGVVEQNGKMISGPLNDKAILIYATAAGKTTTLTADQVKAHVVYDDDGKARSFVLQPMVLLGSASQDTPYTVVITSSLQKENPKNVSIFSGLAEDYPWSFTVSTQTDLIPPRVVSVIPIADGTFDRNITIQVTFSEPLNLASAVGSNDGADKKFTNIAALTGGATGKIIFGKWQPGPNFSSLEFTTFEGCGKNSCGVDIFCLPASADITVLAKAGELQDPGKSPLTKIGLTFSGITDTSGNALDGGGEKAAKPWSNTAGATPQGSPTDDFWFKFKTTSAKKITAPKIMKVDPPIKGADGKDVYATTMPIVIDFDSLMKQTTFKDVELRAKNPKAQAGFWKTAENKTQTVNNVEQNYTVLTINHVPLAKNQPYAGVAPSSIQDVYQNCYLPSAGLSCDGIQQKDGGTLYCCNGKPSNSSCELLKYGSTTK